MEPSSSTLPISAVLLLKLKLFVYHSAAVTPSLRVSGLWASLVCHREPVSIRVWRSRGLLTHGWRDRRRCTERWSLCRCRTRQSGISRPGRWCCWSEPKTTILHNTCEGKRLCLYRLPWRRTARITDYLSFMGTGFTITGISRVKRWCLKRNQDTSHMEWRQTCFGRDSWSQRDKTDHSL